MSNNQEFDYLFKLLIMGNTSINKSAFLFRVTENRWNNNYTPTIGLDFISTKILLNIFIENYNY